MLWLPNFYHEILYRNYRKMTMNGHFPKILCKISPPKHSVIKLPINKLIPLLKFSYGSYEDQVVITKMCDPQRR